MTSSVVIPRTSLRKYALISPALMRFSMSGLIQYFTCGCIPAPRCTSVTRAPWRHKFQRRNRRGVLSADHHHVGIVSTDAARGSNAAPWANPRRAIPSSSADRNTRWQSRSCVLYMHARGHAGRRSCTTELAILPGHSSHGFVLPEVEPVVLPPPCGSTPALPARFGFWLCAVLKGMSPISSSSGVVKNVMLAG